MPIIDFLDKWGKLVAQNPIVFICFFLVIAGLTWKVTSFAYAGRIDTLKEKLSFLETRLSAVLSGSTNDKPGLSQDQYGYLVRHIRTCPSPCKHDGKTLDRLVYIEVAVGFPENEAIAVQIRDAIKDCGWKCVFSGPNDLEMCRDGIWVLGYETSLDDSPSTPSVIRAAFAGAGLKTSLGKYIQEIPPHMAMVVIGRIAKSG